MEKIVNFEIELLNGKPYIIYRKDDGIVMSRSATEQEIMMYRIIQLLEIIAYKE